jgi:hypothetical protein
MRFLQPRDIYPSTAKIKTEPMIVNVNFIAKRSAIDSLTIMRVKCITNKFIQYLFMSYMFHSNNVVFVFLSFSNRFEGVFFQTGRSMI